MKHLNNLPMLLLVVAFTMISCSVESVETDPLSFNIDADTSAPPLPCNDEDPKAKISNNSSTVVDMQIYDENGVLINHAYGVPAGGESGWLSFDPGEVSVVISNTSAEKAIGLEMDTCMAYHVTIDENYQLDTDQPTQL